MQRFDSKDPGNLSGLSFWRVISVLCPNARITVEPNHAYMQYNASDELWMHHLPTQRMYVPFDAISRFGVEISAEDPTRPGFHVNALAMPMRAKDYLRCLGRLYGERQISSYMGRHLQTVAQKESDGSFLPRYHLVKKRWMYVEPLLVS